MLYHLPGIYSVPNQHTRTPYIQKYENHPPFYVGVCTLVKQYERIFIFVHGHFMSVFARL